MRKLIFLTSLCSIFLLLSGSAFCSEELVIQPDFLEGKDSFVRDSDPDHNYDGDPQMHAGFNPLGTHISFLEFPLDDVPSGAVITSAQVEVYGIPYGTFDVEVFAYAVDSSWIEQAVCWNNQPALGEQLDSDAMSPGNQGLYYFDITNLAAQWLNGSRDNNGIALKTLNSSDNNVTRFFTSDAVDAHPILRLTFNPPPTATPQPTNTPRPTSTFTATPFPTYTPAPTHTPPPPPPPPTNTPAPTNTPHKTNTPRPTATPTHSAQTPTPTPSPHNTATPGTNQCIADLQLSASFFTPGTPFRCTVRYGLIGGAGEAYPLVVALNVANQWFFAPDFTQTFNGYTVYPRDDIQTMTVIPEFLWPDHAGSATGVSMYAAMLTPDMSDLLSPLDHETFGWSE